MLKYFRGAPLKIYLHEYLTHEYFHTRKFPDLRYIEVVIKQIEFVEKDCMQKMLHQYDCS